MASYSITTYMLRSGEQLFLNTKKMNLYLHLLLMGYSRRRSMPFGVDHIWSSCVWQTILPPNISALLWKLVKDALHVDCRVRAKDISLASIYRYCTRPSEESIIHLFIQTDMTKRVWKHFTNIFRVSYVYGSVLHELSTWMARRSSSSQYVCVGLGSPRIFFEKLGLVSVELLMKIYPPLTRVIFA